MGLAMETICTFFLNYEQSVLRGRQVDDFVDDPFNWLAIEAAVLVHFFCFAPTAIEQDCGSRDARTGRRARFHHDSGQRFDRRVGI